MPESLNPPGPDGWLDRVQIVLSHTTHPGNIGASARAMKTMGFSRLTLVDPLHLPEQQAYARASGADDILDSARICADLAQALENSVLVVGCTARRRDLSHPMASVRNVARQTAQTLHQGEVTWLFGTELAGLSNAQLDLCHQLANIPAASAFSSLNLAAAVQVVCYELRHALLQDQGTQERAQTLATHTEMENFYSHLESVLLESGFLDPSHPGRLMTRLRRLFARARVEHEEVSILRGILNLLNRND